MIKLQNDDATDEDRENIANIIENKSMEEASEIVEIADNHNLSIDEAEKVKDLIDEEGLDEDEAVELAELLD